MAVLKLCLLINNNLMVLFVWKYTYKSENIIFVELSQIIIFEVFPILF